MRDSMKSPVFWRTVLGAKLVLALGIWISLDGDFRFGDRPVAAKDTAATDSRPADTTEKAAPAKGATGKDSGTGAAAPETGVTKASGTAETAAKPESDKTQGTTDQAPIPKTRKSFLSNLLELPALDPERVGRDEAVRYLEVAKRKERQIEERLGLLKEREEQLKKLESSIDGKLQSLEKERQFFQTTMQDEKKLKGERIDRLVATYSKMEPKKAAPVFEKMDKDLVVELFKQLPQKQVTNILEAMSPDKSVQLTEYYGRVRSAREYDLLKEMNQSLRVQFDDCKGLPQ